MLITSAARRESLRARLEMAALRPPPVLPPTVEHDTRHWERGVTGERRPARSRLVRCASDVDGAADTCYAAAKRKRWVGPRRLVGDRRQRLLGGVVGARVGHGHPAPAAGGRLVVG
jgi:hypothetical protein